MVQSPEGIPSVLCRIPSQLTGAQHQVKLGWQSTKERNTARENYMCVGGEGEEGKEGNKEEIPGTYVE